MIQKKKKSILSQARKDPNSTKSNFHMYVRDEVYNITFLI
jgi:hypothetical protein